MLAAFVAGLFAAGVAAASDGDRTLTFVNQCPVQTLRVGVNGGNVGACTGQDNSCPAGASCLMQGGKPRGCFWDLPAFDRVLAPTGSVSVAVANAPNGTTKWSGNFYASTGCDANGNNCQASSCDGGHCPSGVGPAGPTSLAEITMVTNSVDTYDVSLINGVNIPVAIGPTATPMLTATRATASTDPYYCQEAGSAQASGTGLLACSWSFSPPTVNGHSTTDKLPLVAAGGAACGSGDSSCPGDQVCGYPGGTNQAQQVCGTQLGWWTADELCSAIPTGLGAPFNCDAEVTGQGTQKELYACSGTTAGNSCYTDGAADTCCGCPSWNFDQTSLPLAVGQSCQSTNAQWTNLALPWAQFVKAACPTAYSFPYDDATSTFTCASSSTPTAANPNSVGYTITFCPGGKTGF